jgi:glutathione S-transferase
LGVSLDIVVLNDETRVSKEQKAKNPTGKYPLLESKEGTLAGIVPIAKYLCKKSKKLLGDNSALTLTKIDQWCFWTVSQMEPTC